MKLPFEDNTFDHVYTIEAVCHAPDKVYQNNHHINLDQSLFFSLLIRQNVLLKLFVYLNQVVH